MAKSKRLSGGVFAVRLFAGEELISGLLEFARTKRTGGAVWGIGALAWAEIGYFDEKSRTYLRRRVTGGVELASLMGNLVFVDDKPTAHLHAVLATKDFATVGGHLFAAEVSVTAEIIVLPWEAGELSRARDERTGLALWEI